MNLNSDFDLSLKHLTIKKIYILYKAMLSIKLYCLKKCLHNRNKMVYIPTLDSMHNLTSRTLYLFSHDCQPIKTNKLIRIT